MLGVIAMESGIRTTVTATLKADAPKEAHRFLKLPRAGLFALAGTALAVTVALGVALYGVYGYNRIYKGVSCEGVDLSGLTRPEAAALLGPLVFDSVRYPDETLTVRIDGHELAFGSGNTGARVVQDATAEDAAELAYRARREGGFFPRLGGLLNRGPVELAANSAGSVYINKELIFDMISKVTQQIETPAQPMQYARDGDTLTFTRPVGGLTVDPSPIAELVARRLEECDFAALTFSSSPVLPEAPDLDAVRNGVYEPPIDAEVTGSAEDGYSIQPHQAGTDMDIAPVRAWLDSSDGPDTLRVTLTHPQPEITQAYLNDRLFRDQLSRAQTDYASSTSGRKHNIKMASDDCNDWILLPGEQFSFGGAVGKITEARGYQQAGGYVGGKLVDDVVGGGICQVTSTIYYAALLADLKIVQRACHYMTVAYLPTGLDATFYDSGGGPDLVIENDKTYPIQLKVEATGRQIIVTFVGTKENDHTVTMERETLVTKPFETIYVNNPNLAAGASVTTTAGHTGYTVDTYRVIKDAKGNEISRTFEAKSTYRRVDAVVERGPEPPALPATPEPVTPAPTAEPTPIPEPEPTLPAILPTDGPPEPVSTPEPAETLPPPPVTEVPALPPSEDFGED